MTKITIEVEQDQVDALVQQELIDCRAAFLKDKGNRAWVFSWEDQEADDAEIQRHIDALDVVISWFCTPDQIKEIYG
jgi:hypothetical protein